MNFNILLIFGLVFLVSFSLARPAEEEYAEYEDEAEAPPPKKPAGRAPLIGRRNPLAGRNNKAAPSTTPAAPKEEAPEEEDYVEEEIPAETSSTTESPKKFIKGGIVRPFRSNEDLLATLKKRREQAVNNKNSKPVQSEQEEEPAAASEPVAKPSKSTGGRRNRFQKEKASELAAPAEEAAPAPARTGRRFNSRS